MYSRTALLDTLLWAAGAPRTPRFAEVDEERLLHALLRHRLETRLLFRARAEGITVPPAVLEEVTRRHTHYVEVVDEQIRTFRRLQVELERLSPGEKVLPIKGFGLYALTGREEHIRYSWDVDVMGTDPAAVVEAARTITEEGYHFHGEDHPYVYAHMDGIEVHTRYLVTSFPKGVGPEGLDPQLNPGVLRLQEPFVAAPLTYPDLAANLAVDADLPVEVPRAEMALLIRLAHIYVGYAIETRPFPYATVRLEELCQVRELAALPGFDPEVFRGLIERHHGHVVLGFARHLCRELFGSDPFEDAGHAAVLERLDVEWFPQNLWWDGIDAGFPTRLGWTPEDLVVRTEEWPDLVDELGAWELAVDADGRCSATTRDRDVPGARWIEHAFHGGLEAVDVDLALGEQGLRTTVRLPASGDDSMSAIGLACAETRVELFFKPRESQAEFSDYSFVPEPGKDMTSQARVDGDRHVLVVDLPWSAFGRTGAPAAGDTLRLVVRARRQVRPWNEVTGGVVLPLLVRC